MNRISEEALVTIAVLGVLLLLGLAYLGYDLATLWIAAQNCPPVGG